MYPKSIPLLLLVALSVSAEGGPVASICSVQWSPSAAFEIFENLIFQNLYRKDVRPVDATDVSTSPTSTTNVNISFYLLPHVESVSTSEGKFTAHFFFRQIWKDPRLAFENSPQYQNLCNGNRPEKLVLPDSMISEIWKPDIFIRQELSSKRHGLFRPEQLVKVSADGTILLSYRVSITLACPDFVKAGPAKKECPLYVESYGYLEEELKLDWKENPIHFENSTFIPGGFKLEGITPLRCDEKVGEATYSCVQAKFTFA